MPMLPARIPDIPETRAEIVPARLARKVGPLFGVSWDDSPFGHRTWVSDYSRITLSEIARGAPLPTRAQSAQLAGLGGEPWRIVERIGITAHDGALPNEIANATLNRFGPDTRAAVVLTATNRLLDPVRRAIEAALDLLVAEDGSTLAPELRLAAWTVLIIETFRSQPALVVAGISARAIQRELVTAWQLPLASRLGGMPLTRCEVSAPDRPVSPSQPCDLEFVDATFVALALNSTAGPAVVRRTRHDEIVERLLRRLRAAGTLQDASHLWLSERRDGELVVEALVPPTQLTHDFVSQFLPVEAELATLPRIPSPDEFRRLPMLTRRALLIALLGVLRHVQSLPDRRERTRAGVVAALSAIAALAHDGLATDDPVRPVVQCRTALMTVQTLRHDTSNDLKAAVPELLTAADDCIAAYRTGLLDRGGAAEIISAANIEINAVRRMNATDPAAGLPSPRDLDIWLRASWLAFLDTLEVTPDELARPDPERLGLIGYHLQNYAAFLSWHPDSGGDLHDSVRLFRDVVLPARELFFARGGGFEPLRHALQVASRATGKLAASAVGAGDVETGRTWAALGLTWIRRALADPSTVDLLSGITEAACRFALLAAPALLTAVELDVPDAGETDVQVAAGLVLLVRRWEQRTVGDNPDTTHTRHAEVVDMERRVEKLRGDTSSA